MAERRMLTKKITDADEFISLPSSTQALYLHLTMSADDDGFNNQVQMAIFKAHASVDDLRLLLAKRFIIQFDNGVIVIKHWRMANALRKDRYIATAYQEELKMLKIKDNGAYSLDGCQMVASRLPDGCQMVAEGKDSIGKDSIGENRINEVSSLRSDTSCGEPSKSATPPKEPPEPVFIKIPLNDKTEYEVTEKKVAEYQETYPAVDIRQQLRNMRQWSIDNPNKRKTRVGITRFMNSWMQREQDRGGQRYQSQQSSDAEWLAKKEREKNERK